MKKEAFEKLIRDHLESKSVHAGIINGVITDFSGRYSRGNYPGKATALITKAIKEGLATQKKRNSDK
jgi:hypothetical protein